MASGYCPTCETQKRLIDVNVGKNDTARQLQLDRDHQALRGTIFFTIMTCGLALPFALPIGWMQLNAIKQAGSLAQIFECSECGTTVQPITQEPV